MLLTLPCDLLYLVSYHLSRVEWLCLIQCHSHFRFLTTESYWRHRLQHDTKCVDYVRAKPDSVTWREWYLISQQQLRAMNLGTHHDKDVSIRPWYTSQYFVVDMLGQAYYWLPINNNEVELHKVNVPFKRMIGRCVKSYSMHHLIIDDKQRLIAVQGLFQVDPHITLLYDQVTEATHLEDEQGHIVVISTVDGQLLYFRGSVDQLLSPDRVWTNICSHRTGTVRCLNAYFFHHSNNLTIEFITEDGVHHVSTLSSFGWYSGVKPNKSDYVYVINSHYRLEMEDNRLTIGKRGEASQPAQLKWRNGVAQIFQNVVTMCPHNLARGKYDKYVLGLVLSDK